VLSPLDFLCTRNGIQMPLTPNETLRELRRARGLTQKGLADLIQVSRDTERRWEQGRVPHPRIRQLKALADVLGVPMEKLGFGPPSQAKIDPINLADEPFTVSAISRALSVLCDNDQVERRSFTLLTGTALVEPATRYLAVSPFDLVDHGGRGMQITDRAVDALDTINGQLRILDDQGGGDSLLQATQGQIRFMHNVLNNSCYSASMGRRLHASLAETLRIAGWVSYDLGRHAQAQHLWVTALRATHAAGDQAQSAHILGHMSEQARQVSVTDAVPLAQTALENYRGTNHKATAIFHLQAAQAYGHHGDLNACRRAIDAAFDSLDKAQSHDDVLGWTYWIAEWTIHVRGAGLGYYALGKWELAQQHLQAALALQDSPPIKSMGGDHLRNSALCYTMLATAYLAQGDVEQACHSATKTIDLFGGNVQSQQCIIYLDRFTHQLGRYQASPAAREFIERMRSLTATAA
jgi:transcriptional regulator with XRE-family HTH domain